MRSRAASEDKEGRPVMAFRSAMYLLKGLRPDFMEDDWKARFKILRLRGRRMVLTEDYETARREIQLSSETDSLLK